jgi:hypothetical protein
MNEDPNVPYPKPFEQDITDFLSLLFIFSITNFQSYHRDDSCFGSGISIFILFLVSNTYR